MATKNSHCVRLNCNEPIAEGHSSYCQAHHVEQQINAKRQRENRRSRGLCNHCESPSVPGRALCEKHTEVRKALDLQRRAKRREAGLCWICRAPIVAGSRGIHAAPNRERTTCDTCSRRKYNTPWRRFRQARDSSKGRVGWSLTFEEFLILIAQPCHYCKLPHPEHSGRGLDRLDNARGYHLDNVVSCCPECNMVRNNIFSVEEMLTTLGPAVRRIKLARQGIVE